MGPLVAAGNASGGVDQFGDFLKPQTVAADQSIFPFGTVLYIEGVGVRVVQDKGSGIQGKHLDVAVSGTHEDALAWPGYGKHKVWVIKEVNENDSE